MISHLRTRTHSYALVHNQSHSTRDPKHFHRATQSISAVRWSDLVLRQWRQKSFFDLNHQSTFHPAHVRSFVKKIVLHINIQCAGSYMAVEVGSVPKSKTFCSPSTKP